MSKSLRGPQWILGILFVAAVAFTGCANQANSSGVNQPATSNQSATPATSTPSAGQIVISGAVSKSFTPASTDAGTLGNKMIINLHENATNTISLSLPPDTQPGTYSIEDSSRNPAVDFSGQYASFTSNAFYLSTKGTLTLTAVGSKFSGNFQFTGAYNKDSSKTIDVSGSFTDVPVSSS